jgi:hypothetical protein
MNIAHLMNVVNHPDVIPEYHQQDGRLYHEVFDPNVVWRFHKIGEDNWFEMVKPLEPIRRDPKIYESFDRKVFVVEVKDE